MVWGSGYRGKLMLILRDTINFCVTDSKPAVCWDGLRNGVWRFHDVYGLFDIYVGYCPRASTKCLELRFVVRALFSMRA